MLSLRKYWALLTSFCLFFIFLPQNSYAGDSVPVSDGFDFPLGKPDAAGYGVECCGGLPWLGRYDYEGDGLKEYHPGEDWNGMGQDAGDPVYSISSGTIIFSGYVNNGWGYLVLIEHQVRDGSRYWSQYAHLKDIDINIKNKKNINVTRGARIGYVGDFEHGSGKSYHLHFEIRKKYRPADAFVYDWSREKVEEYYVNPSEFIRANRPLPPPTPQKLTLVSASQGAAELSWDECTDPAFGRYELYRSEIEGGTLSDGGRELLATYTGSKVITHQDMELYAGQDYFYGVTTHYQDGRIAVSNEIKVNIPRENINISNKAGGQRYVGASKGKIYWEDMAREGNAFPERKTFYYYDLADKVVKTITIGDPYDNRIQGPDRPQIAGNWLCYNAKSSRYGNYGVFCRNLTAGNMSADIRISPGDTLDYRDPYLSEEGIVVFKGGTGGRLWWADLNDGTEVHELTDHAVYQPRIWGDNIIYQTPVSANSYKLWLANIKSGTKTLLKEDTYINTADIWEGRVVFCRGNNTYLVDISRPETETLISERSYLPRIRDGKVVYSRLAADGSYYVNVYNIAAKKTITVAGPLKYLPGVAVYGNNIAYEVVVSESTSDTDIFLTYL